jgi:2-keto-3-deoxy-L-rhamnonate aldolase RhmA
MRAGEALTGTFVKTPAHEIVEVLALAGLDFLCLDAEHAPFDRRGLDVCLAMGRALGVPMLVRVPAGRPEIILGALDSGAEGIVVPHVDSVARAEEVARAARFGLYGRGYAGSTRWAGIGGGRAMSDLVARSAAETVVLVQIEEPAGVEAAPEIAQVAGVDGLFIGPADLTVAHGHFDLNNADLARAYDRVGWACRQAGKTPVTWCASAERGQALRARHDVQMLFVASEHAWMLEGARHVAHALKPGT